MESVEDNGDAVLKSFFRQSEALDFYRSENDKNLFVYSWEVGRCGERKYMVTTLDRFWSFYQGLQHRSYYEVIVESEESKLYLDLEYIRGGNELKDGYEMTKYLIQKINDHLLSEYDVNNSMADILILESTTDEKFSIHLVFFKIHLESNIACGQLITQLLNSFNAEDKKHFQVLCKGSKEGCFIDSGVYSRNRNFRLFKSTKRGKKTPFLLSKLDQSSEMRSSDVDQEFSIFKSSIITNIQADSNLIVCRGFNLTKDRFSTPSLHQFPSPFNEIDDYLSNLIKAEGGSLSSWKYVTEHENYIYNTVGYRFCANVNRKHSKNNVFFIFLVGAGILRQGCNRCMNFYSESINVKHLLPWLYEGEFWDQY